jgi:membrane-associated phospholipid phosphatase
MSDRNRTDVDEIKTHPKEISEPEVPPTRVQEQQPARDWRTIFLWVYILLALAGSAALSLLAYQIPYLSFDPPITLALQSYRAVWFFTLMVISSWPGYMPQAVILVGVLVVLIYFLGYRWEALIALLSVISSTVLNLIVKLVVHQPRPQPDLVHVVKKLSSYSYPSGHVMFFMGFYAILWYLSYKVLQPSWYRTFLLVLFGAMVVLVGVSRIYLGEHWFSDVLGGYILGSVVLILMIRLYHWGKPRFFKG